MSTGGSEMGTEAERTQAASWRDRVLAGADGVLHAASCCAPDAWLTDRRTPWDPTDEAADTPEPAGPCTEGRVHVVGRTRG